MQKPRRSDYMECHAFRKYFETIAKVAGMDLLLLKRCMGHDTGLEESYFEPIDEQILEGNDKMMGYIGIMDDLTIDETNILRRKVKTLEVRADRLEELAQTLAAVKAQLGIE